MLSAPRSELTHKAGLERLPWPPTATNRQRARAYLTRSKAQIQAGSFCFRESFPNYRGRRELGMPLSVQSCSAVFDAFLHHESARVVRGDLAPITLASHRQILDHVWRPHIGPLPFERLERDSDRQP